MSVVSRMDQAVNAFVARCAWFHQPMTKGRARMFALQHRLNTRQRNSVLKLKVATNCSDWDTRMRIIQACSEEVIADHEHGGGRPHWKILEDLGLRIGLKRRELQDAQPLPSTELAWAAWEGLMANRHWLEGIVANTCAERINVPGYGSGLFRKHGWFGIERLRWGKLFGLAHDELEFFELHTEADIEHSDTGLRAVEKFARQLRMEDAVVKACERNLYVWEHYLDGIAAAGDASRPYGISGNRRCSACVGRRRAVPLETCPPAGADPARRRAGPSGAPHRGAPQRHAGPAGGGREPRRRQRRGGGRSGGEGGARRLYAAGRHGQPARDQPASLRAHAVRSLERSRPGGKPGVERLLPGGESAAAGAQPRRVHRVREAGEPAAPLRLGRQRQPAPPDDGAAEGTRRDCARAYPVQGRCAGDG